MLKLPALFADGMVISKKAKIWGWGEPGENITASFLGKAYKATCDAAGRFELTIISESYGGPHELTIGDKIINDVYVGRVWLCGGQSNMEGPLGRAALMMPEHIIEDSRIRFFQVEKGLRFDAPATDTNAIWRTATGDMSGLFAVPYFFARQLLSDDPTPIGLICTPAGGTPIEGWMPEDLVQDFPEYYEVLKPMKIPGYMESQTEEANRRVSAWHTELTANDKGFLHSWADENFDDSAWQTRMLLDSSGLPEYGSIWLRKKISLPKQAGKVILKFGRIENSVKVYVNGVQVISVDYMYPPCTCVLPEGLLKVGENTIAVRIVGDANHPKIVPGKEYALVHTDWRVDLNGEWKWNVGTEMPKAEPGAWFYNRPCGVYNYMLAPVLGYSVDGILWYQGESNTGRPSTYKDLFTAFAKHMREKFGNVPIIFNQLANYVDSNPGTGENWAELREQQRKCLEIENTAMSVSIDCGEWNDLHPLDKKTVGERMALHARKLAYDENIVSDGPVVKHAECRNGKLIISFENGIGLWAKNGYPIVDVLDNAGHVHKFFATIEKETLTADIGKLDAKIVRFGWVDCPSVTVYNAYNLPASPFMVKIVES